MAPSLQELWSLMAVENQIQVTDPFTWLSTFLNLGAEMLWVQKCLYSQRSTKRTRNVNHAEAVPEWRR